ncbi:unnamed protein product [Alternaria alternata]
MGSISAALANVRNEISSSLEKGTPWNTLVGLHPNVAALFDENSFKKAPFLSQWAASMVHSVKKKDFLVWPKLRDIAVQSTALQENMDWMVEQTATVCCHWPHTIKEALHKDEVTAQQALTIAAKTHIFDLANWSVGPSLRAHLSNADMYVTIRPQSD